MAFLVWCSVLFGSFSSSFFKFRSNGSALWGYLLVVLFAFLLNPCLSKKPGGFRCPQQFGYFQDMTNCNKYFICVFGDAVRDQCTPGLYFNNELRMCDWPRNVKNCKDSRPISDGSVSSSPSTNRPRVSNNKLRNNRNNADVGDDIASLNSIAPVKPTQNTRSSTRYTPPISSEYIAAARNATHTHFRPISSLLVKPSTTTTMVNAASSSITTTTKPLINAPASFKPVYYRVTNKPFDRSGYDRSAAVPRKRKDYDEDSEYYDDDYEDDESSEEDRPKMIFNRNLRGGNNVYVTPIDPKTSVRPRLQSYHHNRVTNPRPRGIYSTMSTYDSRFVNSNGNYKPRTNVNNTYTTPASNFQLRGREIINRNRNPGRNSVSDESSSGESSEEKRTTTVYTYNRNADSQKPYGYSITVSNRGPPYSQQIANQQRPRPPPINRNMALSNTYTNRPRDSDVNIQLRPQVHHAQVSVSSVQSLDSQSGDSLDAQFGTNPRSISLPDAPYKLNSFDDKQPKRNTQHREKKPQQFQPKYIPVPPKQNYQPDSNSGYDDDYSDYYYDDDDEYYDDDDKSLPPVRPKVVIRVQPKPSTTQRPTTRRPAAVSTTTTRRPPTTRAAKRPLPIGISRPATKRPLHFGPRPLPRLPSRPQSVYQTPQPLSIANKCNPNTCVFPDCRCASTDIPGNLLASQIPQIVLITFDDAVNDLNYELYAEIFDNRRNPNGCPILGTFYVSHEWTDYGMVQSLYSKGHEMASHSITHSHGEKFSINTWKKEINGQREILHLYGGVKMEDIRGMRAPFLQVGGNNMFEMLYDSNFTYDSSMPVLDNNPPFYPYTLDYNIGHECMIPPCPTKSFPGLWEVGMVMWNDYRGGRCSMGDACANPDNSEDVYKMLLKNFNRHYESNRAPFGLFYHAAWFTTQHYRKGYLKFIEHINSKNDVYIVTNWQAIQWMREPTPLSHIKSFRPWQCPKNPDASSPCYHPKGCSLAHKSGGSRDLKTCQPCPSSYPWTGRTGFNEVYA